MSAHAERAERKRLWRWMQDSLIEADMESLRFIACVAYVRTRGQRELQQVIVELDKLGKWKGGTS